MPIKDGQPVTGMSTADDEHELLDEPKYYFYDEWDFRAGDYRPRWCRIVEYAVGEGTPAYYDQTLTKYASLVGQTRRQFELLRPEMFRKIKRLLDGEEIDFDAVIEYAVERRAGVTPNDKVYWRRNKIERDVSRGLPARHERLDRRGDREARAQVPARTTSTTTRGATSPGGWPAARRSC